MLRPCIGPVLLDTVAKSTPMPRSRTPVRDGLLRRIEAMAVRDTQRYWALMPTGLAARLRTRVGRAGDALLTLCATSDSLRMNRVIGLGARGRARPTTLDEILAFYRASRIRRFSIMLGPGPQADSISRWLRARGFAPRGGHALLVRDCRLRVPPATGKVRIARARPRDANLILDIHEQVFAIARSRRSWARAAIIAGGTEHYLAYLGTAAAGTGALRIDGDLAWLGGGATLRRWRGRGTHRALIAARLRRARRRGCRWAWVETVARGPGRSAISHRNLVRMGFVQAAVRPVFVWRGR